MKFKREGTAIDLRTELRIAILTTQNSVEDLTQLMYETCFNMWLAYEGYCIILESENRFESSIDR